MLRTARSVSSPRHRADPGEKTFLKAPERSKGCRDPLLKRWSLNFVGPPGERDGRSRAETSQDQEDRGVQ